MDTRIKEAISDLEWAMGSLGDARADCPAPAWREVGDDAAQAEQALARMLRNLRLLDPEFCDLCGNWKDSALHEAYCVPDPLAEPHKEIRDALIGRITMAGMPVGNEGGMVEHDDTP